MILQRVDPFACLRDNESRLFVATDYTLSIAHNLINRYMKQNVYVGTCQITCAVIKSSVPATKPTFGI